MKQKRSVLQPGEKVLGGKYEILKVLHSHGMANVYIVLDNNLHKNWCMKEIKKSEAGKNQIEYYSLLQEAAIMKSLNHSNIPRIVTIENDGDSVFIVMDYVDGMSIKDWMMRSKSSTGRVPQDLAVAWMKQICQVMIYLHNRKKPIFYRDMKPDNVMIQSDGNIKLLDFGISVVINEPGQKIERALGTKGYAAPEQSKRGNVCDLRSDIYAIGKTFYFMLTGLNPTQIPKDKLRPIREIDSSISVGIEKIVDKCCQENPNDRYQSCEELMYALQNYKTLDTKYRNSLKRKVYLVLSLFIFSVVLISGSFIPLNIHNNQLRAEYSNLLSVANQSGRVDDYVAVLKSNATHIEPYLGLIESIKVDGVFSRDEENTLLNYVNPNLSTLKSRSRYGELAFEIGRLYWFYYEGTYNEGMVTSLKWFSDAMENGYETELSGVYYNLGSFVRNIATAITESSDAGMYATYWNNLILAKEEDTGDLVKLQLNLAIANCISSYAYNLRSDGVDYGKICQQIDELGNFLDQYTPTIERTQEIYDTLERIYPSLQDRVDAVYGGVN